VIPDVSDLIGELASRLPDSVEFSLKPADTPGPHALLIRGDQGQMRVWGFHDAISIEAGRWTFNSEESARGVDDPVRWAVELVTRISEHGIWTYRLGRRPLVPHAAEERVDLERTRARRRFRLVTPAVLADHEQLATELHDAMIEIPGPPGSHFESLRGYLDRRVGLRRERTRFTLALRGRVVAIEHDDGTGEVMLEDIVQEGRLVVFESGTGTRLEVAPAEAGAPQLIVATAPFETKAPFRPWRAVGPT
jgi:hypothetical protein